MQPTPDFDPAKLAKSLLRRSRQGALATLMVGSGDPYCSLVNLASHPDGSPILLISALAVHTRNILADSRVSLMLDERAAGDPLEGARIMLSGLAEPAGAEKDLLERRYLNAHPSAEAFVSFKDFSFFRIRPTGTHLVAGFGRIVDLKPEQFLTDLSGAEDLMAAEEGAVEHMNADHRDAMGLYATRLLGAAAGDWRCTGCDPEGLDMQDGQTALRLDFPERVTSGTALRKMLVRLAGEARAKTEEPRQN
ncbi:HugZ family pyridoxamine 5'-phosphate oxidase [Bradyrhizobium diazoefficiens]|uniref:HugZ family pyridoxamine 5'-phosphate oxidase n=1 Tax=Bradyrhizobium diazoefficiens TaxID=1355477 RepID=UPI001B64E6D0|nr:putative heme iron utilization protein [Bradyrhizobium japonicum]